MLIANNEKKSQDEGEISEQVFIMCNALFQREQDEQTLTKQIRFFLIQQKILCLLSRWMTVSSNEKVP